MSWAIRMLAEVALDDCDDRRLCCFPSQNQRLNQFEFVAITGDLSQVPKEVGELERNPISHFLTSPFSTVQCPALATSFCFANSSWNACSVSPTNFL